MNTPMHQAQPMPSIKQEIVHYLNENDDENLPYVSAPISTIANNLQPYATQYSLNTTNIAPTITKNFSNTDFMVVRSTNTHQTTNNTDRPLYGTYDKENHLITVTLPDEDISNFEEVIEEIVCNDDEDEYLSQVSTLSPINQMNYPSPGYASDCSNGTNSNFLKSPASDHDSAYDSIINSPPGQISSALSTTSSLACMDDDLHFDCWPDSFSVLLY